MRGKALPVACEFLAACLWLHLPPQGRPFELALRRTKIQWPGVEPEPMAPLPRLENALTAAVAATLRGIRMMDAAAGQRREGSALLGKKCHWKAVQAAGERNSVIEGHHKTR